MQHPPTVLHVTHQIIYIMGLVLLIVLQALTHPAAPNHASYAYHHVMNAHLILTVIHV